MNVFAEKRSSSIFFLTTLFFIISMFLYHAYHGSCRCNVPGDTMRAWMCASNAHYNLLRCTCHWNYIWWKYQLRHECSMQQINIENIQHVGKWIFREMVKFTLAFYKRCRMDLLKSRTKLCGFQTLLRYEDDSCMPFLKGARFWNTKWRASLRCPNDAQ